MKIALCLLAHENSNGVLQNRYFPLSIGLIAEFIKVNHKDVEIDLFKKPSEFTNYLKTNRPDIVMFGNYMWIEKLNTFYAKEVKKIKTNTLVVFGGPNFSIDDDKKIEFLNDNKHIDFLVEGDGEIVANLIVEKFKKNNKNIELTKKENIPNTISILKENNKPLIPGAEDFRIGVGDIKLEHVPSPYLSGTMDIFFEDGTIPLLESNRGCPYSCTFCAWGVGSGNKLIKKMIHSNKDSEGIKKI